MYEFDRLVTSERLRLEMRNGTTGIVSNWLDWNVIERMNRQWRPCRPRDNITMSPCCENCARDVRITKEMQNEVVKHRTTQS